MAVLALYCAGSASAASESPTWHQTTAGCKWWGVAASGNSEIAWTGQCPDGLAHGEGRFEWQDSTGQHKIGSTTFLYRGMQVTNSRRRNPDYDRHCFDLINSLELWISPLDPYYSHRLTIPRQDHHTRFVKQIEIHSYEFNISIAFSAYDWCSGSGLSSGSVLVTTDDEISQSNLLQSSFVKTVFETSLAIAKTDTEDKKNRKYIDDLEYMPSSVLLVGKQASNYRILAQGQLHFIGNYSLEEHQRQVEEEARRRKETQVAEAKTQSKQKYDDFVRQHGIVSWPQRRELASNPFRYEGQIVGIRATFSNMIERSSALFLPTDAELGVFYVVDGVPSTDFSGGEYVLLVGRVKGIKKVQVPGLASLPAVNLGYVAVHLCNDPKCSDLFYWNQ